MGRKKKPKSLVNTLASLSYSYTKIRTYIIWQDRAKDLPGKQWFIIADDYIRCFDSMEAEGIPESVQNRMLEGIKQRLDYLDIEQDIILLLNEVKFFEF